MKSVQLPASVLPARNEAGKAPQSALSHYLGAHLTNVRDGLHYDMVQTTMEGALALAVLHPFDPEERVTQKRGNLEAQTHSLVEAVLLLSNVHRSRPARRKWPQTMDGFADLASITKEAEPTVDNEWVAAALVAAGCNPWKDNTVPTEVSLALNYGFDGLVDRLLECPGALSAQVVGDARSTYHYATKKETNWEILASGQERYLALLPLLERGARIENEEVLVRTLSNAVPEAVALLATFGVIELSAAARKRITAAWKERTQTLNLPSQEVEAMQIALWGEPQNNMSEAALDIAKSLSVEWGKKSNGSSANAYDFSGGVGAEKLLGNAVLKSGPMAGQWSYLAAAAVSRIRQSENLGAAGWLVSEMLWRKFDNEERIWKRADCSKPPFAGSLASAIGFDWRPGIAIDGPVALALFGQTTGNMPGKSQDGLQEGEVQARIKVFAAATGIEDIQAWGVEHAQAAAKFTTLVLKGGQVNAARCMLHSWDDALHRHPKLAEGISEDTAADLVLALTGKFQLCVLWANSSQQLQKAAFEGVTSKLFPTLDQDSFLNDAALTGAPLRVALVKALAHRGKYGDRKQSDETLDMIEARAADLGNDDFAIAETWIKALTVNESEGLYQKQALSRLEAMRLDKNTVAAPARNPDQRKMRL